MKFLVSNYSCLQNPWMRGYLPQIPVLSVLCPELNLLKPPPGTKFLGTPLLGSLDPRPPFAERNSPLCGWRVWTAFGHSVRPGSLLLFPWNLVNFRLFFQAPARISLAWLGGQHSPPPPKSEVLAVVLPKIEVFWDVLRGRLEESYCTTQPFVYSSVSQPLWDRGPVNSFFTRRGPGPNKFARKYLSNFFKFIQ